jgi:hypothetical protein
MINCFQNVIAVSICGATAGRVAAEQLAADAAEARRGAERRADLAGLCWLTPA